MRKLALVSMLPLLYTAQAGSTTLLYKSFDDLIKEADGIVMGRIGRVEARYDNRRDIYTLVTLDQVKVLDGNYARPMLTLRLKGGRINNEIIHMDGSPEFEAGQRVVLFVKNNGRDLVPLVGWGQGMFRIVADAASRQDVIHDSDNNPVVAVQAGHVDKDMVNAPEANILGARKPLSAAAQISAGRTETGEMTPMTAAAMLPRPAMSVQAFIDAINQSSARLAAKVARPALLSADTREALMASDTVGRDAPAPAGTKAPQQLNQSMTPVLPQREQPAQSDTQSQ
ncbi:hypothetical protein [Chitinivorax sp. B]|uniref:hypothetical protein n=1 Tax=Chitinivorax sp. B TaxID=2502235 RepID=UPI0010FA6098|nr:hypothetical protein [Chitinivorax sp. B]